MSSWIPWEEVGDPFLCERAHPPIAYCHFPFCLANRGPRANPVCVCGGGGGGGVA